MVEHRDDSRVFIGSFRCRLYFTFQWKEHERKLMEEENERILEFAKLQQQREEDRMEKKRLLEEGMAAVQHKVKILFVSCTCNALLQGNLTLTIANSQNACGFWKLRFKSISFSKHLQWKIEKVGRRY